jgi:hypothetical protein
MASVKKQVVAKPVKVTVKKKANVPVVGALASLFPVTNKRGKKL